MARRTASLHVFVLSAFALAQPLYDLLARGPEFFLLRRSGAVDVSLTVLAFSLVLPGLLLAAEAAAGLLAPAARRMAHGLLVAGLAGLVVLPALGSAGMAAVPLALGVGTLFAIAYARLAPVRLFLTVLTPAVVVFPALFVYRTWGLLAPVEGAWTAGAAPAKQLAPVVMIVLDEMSLSSLVDDRGGIDAEHYPHFARLARDSTWYRNATTVASVTQAAVPALLTGRYHGPEAVADPSIRARNLFTLLAPSHALRVSETYVPYCPPSLCGEARDDGAPWRRRGEMLADLWTLALRSVLPRELWAWLPPIAYESVLLQDAGTDAVHADDRRTGKDDSLADLAYRRTMFSQFVDDVRPSTRPGLHYLHIMLPHEPSVYLPSGTICRGGRRREPWRWPASEEVVATAYARHLLQVAYVDTMLGRLTERLRRAGLWESTLLVVTADHGVSFNPGDFRRALSPTNYCDILRVPLFVKAPHQRAGRVDDRNVESVDVLPTMADLLGVPIPWVVDGGSLADATGLPRPHKTVLGPFAYEEDPLFRNGARFVPPPDLPIVCADVERKRRWLDVTEGAWRPGRARFDAATVGLIGRRLGDVEIGGRSEVTGRLSGPERSWRTPRAEGVLPCVVSGWVVGPDGKAPERTVAVALNGTIWAVARTVPGSGAQASFTAIVPERAFRLGRNDVELFLVSADASPRLEVLPPALGPKARRRGQASP